MLNVFYQFWLRECRLYWRAQNEAWSPIGYFLILVSIFPMACEPSQSMLIQFGPSIIWGSFLLALVLSIETTFRSDQQEGILEQWVVSDYPLAWLCLPKMCAHILLIAMPLLGFAALAGVFYQLPRDLFMTLLTTLLCGIPAISCLGQCCAALTIGLPRSSLWLSIIVLPLLTPMLILGSRSVLLVSQGIPIGAEIKWMLALSVVMFTLTPSLLAWALKVSIE